MKWLIVLLGVLYALLPLDLLPDPVAGLGWLDDLLLAGLIWYWFFRRAGSDGGHTRSRGGPDAEDSGTQGRQQSADRGEGGEAFSAGNADPYHVLGLERGADAAEIRAAYRRLAAQYHPDKVAHLGAEFQRLAEQKFKAIQAAYEQLQSRF